MGSRTFRASSMKYETYAAAYGADPSGLSDSLSAINTAIQNTLPGGVCYLPPGILNIVQDSTTTIGQVIRTKPGVTLQGAGQGVTYIRRNYWGSPVVAAIRSNGAAIKDMTFLNTGYRTGGTFPTASGWKLAGGSNYDYGTRHYHDWENYYEDLLVSTGLYLTPRDLDCAIYVGGSNNFTIQNIDFMSDYNDERGWWWNCIEVDVNQDQTHNSGLVVKDCRFAKARFGIVAPTLRNATLDGLEWISTWSYAAAPPGHLIYISGSPANYTAAEFILSSNVTITNIVDRHAELLPVYSSPPDYYGDVTIKCRKMSGLTISNVLAVSPTAGFQLYDILDGMMQDCYYDASSCPDDPGRAWGSDTFFMVDQTRVPTTGYTAADYILGPMDFNRVTYISPAPGTYDTSWTSWWRSNPYKTSGGNAPASVGDTWTDVTMYLAPSPSAAVPNPGRLVGSNGTYGTAANPLRFFPHPEAGSWGADQQLLYLEINSSGCAIRAEVEAPTGSFPAGQPPKMVSGSATTSTLNGAAFNSGTTVTFNNTVASPNPNDPPSE